MVLSLKCLRALSIGAVACLGATLSLTASAKTIQAYNVVEPKAAQPVYVIASRSAGNSSSSLAPNVGDFQSIQSPALGPVQNFSAQHQYETYLTQFIMNYNKNLPWEEANTLANAILDYSQFHSVDFRLVTGVIAVESSFRSDAISSSGALGLGQLKPATAQWLGVSNPFDPIDNISGSARYIKYLVSKYNGNLDNALSAYFQGPGFVDKNGVTDVCKPYLEKINVVLAKM